MRDLFFLAFLGVFFLMGFRRPFLLVAVYAYIDIVSPQRLSYFLLNSIPISFIAFGAMVGAWLVMDDKKDCRFSARQGLMLVLLAWCGYTTMTADFPVEALTKWNWVWKAIIAGVFLPLVLRTRLRVEAMTVIMILCASTIIINGAQVQAIGLDAEDARAAHAVERLEDDVLVLGVEGAQARFIRRYQGRRGEFGKLGNGQLFIVVADGGRLVEDAGALLFRQLQQIRAVHIFHVERRILALDDGVKGRQQHFLGGHDLVPVVLVTGQGDMVHLRRDDAFFQRHVLLFEGVHGVAAAGRFAHHGESGIFVGLEACQRIGKECNFHEAVQSECGK